jgi:hypothetical protein
MDDTAPRTLSPGDQVSVRLVKAAREKLRYPAEVLADDGVRVTVRADWAAPGVRDFGFVRFEPGDVFTETYWRDRWYAVKEVRAADGTVKGWYCDVARPAVVGGSGTSADATAGTTTGVTAGTTTGVTADITVEDLDLDLWLSGDGVDVLRLDEDEFAASALTERDPAAAGHAVRALDELEALARGGGLAGLLA